MLLPVSVIPQFYQLIFLQAVPEGTFFAWPILLSLLTLLNTMSSIGFFLISPDTMAALSVRVFFFKMYFSLPRVVRCPPFYRAIARRRKGGKMRAIVSQWTSVNGRCSLGRLMEKNAYFRQRPILTMLLLSFLLCHLPFLCCLPPPPSLLPPPSPLPFLLISFFFFLCFICSSFLC